MSSNYELFVLASRLVVAVDQKIKDGGTVELPYLSVFDQMEKPAILFSKNTRAERCEQCGRFATYVLHMDSIAKGGGQVTYFLCTQHSLGVTNYIEVEDRKEDA